MQVIIYTNAAGAVSVCYPTGELDIEAVRAKDTPAGSLIVENDSLPNADADFFEAWELTGQRVTVNIDKARAMTKSRLRNERAPLLAAADVAFQRALEAGTDTAPIVAEKNRLRDLPALADACATLDELRHLKAAQ